MTEELMDSVEDLQYFVEDYHQTPYEENNFNTSLLPLNSVNQKAFRCIKCNRTYRWKRTLDRHLKFECGKVAQFQCSNCPYRAKRKCHLVNHLFSKRCAANTSDNIFQYL